MRLVIRSFGDSDKLLDDDFDFKKVRRVSRLIHPGKCLELIVALTARYNHWVRETNARLSDTSMEPLAEIAQRDKIA